MNSFEEVEAASVAFGLDELVSLANALLPLYQPESRASDGRQKEEVSPRLVRHLTTLGLLDEAGREGREARYTPRHLLQLLVARRLQAEGYSTGATKKLMSQADAAQLKRWLHSGAQNMSPGDMSLVLPAPQAAPDEGGASNEALKYLQGIRARSPGPERSYRAARSAQSTRWLKVEVEPGLEVQAREGYVLPASPGERDELLKRVWEAMEAATQAARRKR